MGVTLIGRLFGPRLMVVSLAGWGTPVTLFWSSVAGVITEPACSAVGMAVASWAPAGAAGHGAVICVALGVERASSARFVHRVQRESIRIVR